MAEQSFDMNGFGEVAETAPSSDSKTSQKNYNPTTAIIKTQIEAWLQDNTYASLGIVSITPWPESCITFEIKPKYLTNAKKHQFQVFCNDKWRPLFMTSDSSVLEEQINVLNAQIDMQNQSHTPLTITNLLGMFALAYNEKYETSSQNSRAPLVPLTSALQYDNNDSDMELEPLQAPFQFQYDQQLAGHVTPTEEDWEKRILPEVERILYRDNFQPFEVDEWFRRIQVQLNRGDTDRALDIIQHDILGGALPPAHIRQFFSGKSRLLKKNPEEKTYSSVGASPECVNRLQAELTAMKEINTKDLGFTAAPCGTDLLHWGIKLAGFGTDSPFGQELMEWHLSHMSDQHNSFDAEVEIEVKFPPNFPVAGPSFRIIRPRLVGVEADLSASSTEVNNSNNEGNQAVDLTASTMLNKQKSSWDPNKTIVDIILGVRSLLLESGIHVDVKSGDEGYALPTVGNFWRTFTCIAPATANKPELENGGKIIMPATVLEELTQFDMESPMHNVYNPGGMWSNYGKSLRTSHQSTPMVFELSADVSTKRSFCGVEEFTAPEGSIVVPKWMMDNLGVWEGVPISIRRVKLPRGSYVKLQPHTSEFLKVNDTKAMLEWVLPKFVVLSVGDTIVVPYRNQKFSFNVLEVKPGRAIHIIDSDITTDFAPPLDGDTNPFNQFAQVDNATNDNTNTTQSPTKENAAPEKEDIKAPTVGRLDTTNQTEGVDYKICENCKQHIPIQSYNMHSLSCARINWHCPACNVVVQKAQKEQHMQEAHTLVPCECGVQVESRLLASHKSNDCPRRMVQCAYCPLQMPYVERYEHETKCGAQTEKCEICSKYVAKKDMPVHIVDCMEPKRSSPARPAYRQDYASYNDYNPYSPTNFHPAFKPFPPPNRTPPALASTEDTMACPICSQPFQQFDDLQVHMVTDHPSSLESSGIQDNNTQQNTVQD